MAIIASIGMIGTPMLKSPKLMLSVISAFIGLSNLNNSNKDNIDNAMLNNF